MGKEYITGSVATNAGDVPVVSTELSRADRWGDLKATWAIRRMDYTVDPGLYAVGNPGEDSLVFASANYKLSFDTLRRELKGLDAWTMVLDTNGINVWCAAGKGTFGTEEMVNRIEQTRLKEVVSHRKIIAPQLGATGVAAHEVRKSSGFSLVFGPVRASDIHPFLKAGMVATREMRRVRFNLRDRARLIPAEILQGLKYLFPVMGLFVILAGLNRSGYSSQLTLQVGSRSALNLILAYLAGLALAPALLPWLPGRSFSSKGMVSGALAFLIALTAGLVGSMPLEAVAWALIFTSISSFCAMNLTGASTYTSLSGVRKEMRVAVPLQIAAAAVGLALWIIARFV
ncbi:MAG: mercury methylation corrinoid protein HgcA [Candidatus Eisenbacteria bacterium]